MRNKNIEPSAEEQRLLKANSSDTTAKVTDGYFPALALVGGAPAGERAAEVVSVQGREGPRRGGGDGQPRIVR